MVHWDVVFRVCDQKRVKQACSATETFYNQENMYAASTAIVQSKEGQSHLTVGGCAGWSWPLFVVPKYMYNLFFPKIRVYEDSAFFLYFFFI